jgi:hypothetical protein
VRTGSASSAWLSLGDAKAVEISELSALQVDQQARGFVLTLAYGEIKNQIDQPLADDEDFVVHTGDLVLAVRGTVFTVSYTSSLVNVEVESGTVAVLDIQGNELAVLGAGESGEYFDEGKGEFVEGLYLIQNMNEDYLSHSSGSLQCSATSGDVWYLKEAENGAYYVYAENLGSGRLLDLHNDWDTEGNVVKLQYETGYLEAQTWRFVSNGDGTYKIRTAHSSGRVLTANGSDLPTIQTYAETNAQKWVLLPASN